MRVLRLGFVTAATVLSASAARAQLGFENLRPEPVGPLVIHQTGLETETDLAGPTSRDVFEQAWKIANQDFYDAKMHGVDWEAVREELLPAAEKAEGRESLSAVINQALDRLKASHTKHYQQNQREYYEILDVFYPDGVPDEVRWLKPGPVEYVGVGLVSKVIDGKVFAADVYEAGPAYRAGIRAGDELVDVEGEPWGDIVPFRGCAGEVLRVHIRRTAGGELDEVRVIPRRIRPREMFVQSMKQGARIIEEDGKRVAYVRVRSYANVDYHETLRELLGSTFLDAAGSEGGLPLILDMRGGWGGAQTRYMDVFNPLVPHMTMTRRDGPTHEVFGAWDASRDPVVMLVDEGSRSGKEVLAYAFKKNKVGTLVGSRTAGAVLGGSVKPLRDGSVLYLAVADATVDGERLEGVGVTPDVEVSRELEYSAGKDRQLEEAVKVAIEKNKKSGAR